MKRRVLWLLPALLGLALLVACAQAPTPTPTPTPTPVVPPGAETVVALAKESLAKNFNISEDKIKVVSVQEIPVATPPPAPTPPGGATPGPVETPTGTERQFYIVLEVDGKTYEYQGGETPPVPGLPEEGPGLPIIPPEATTLVEKATKDLAKRGGFEEVSIVPMRVESVTWPDESLGVPEKGKAYSPKLTPGFLIILATPEGLVSYHTDLQRVVLAGATPEEGTAITPREGMAVALVRKAKEDLARRVSVSINEIAEVKVEAVDWPDSTLGLGSEGPSLPVVTPGYRITLRAQGQQHLYNTDLTRVVYAGTAPAQP